MSYSSGRWRKCCLAYSTWWRVWSTRLVICIMCFLSAFGLRCYSCKSTNSWDECKSARTTETCDTGPEKAWCAKVYLTSGGLEYFEKYCIPPRACKQDYNPTCIEKGSNTFDCDIYCCDSDDCNAGPAFLVSGILLISCALASLMILVKAWLSARHVR